METLSYQKTKNKMVIRRPHISIIALNLNVLNSPIERYRVADRSKNKTQPNVASRRHISAPKTNIDSK